MKLLFAIPHYCNRVAERAAKYGSQTRGPEERGAAIRRTILALHQLFGPSQEMIQVGPRRTIPANQDSVHELSVCVATVGDAHALPETQLSPDLYEQVCVDVPPLELGFRCHRILAERGSDCDYCCYLEDDLVMQDPWWFEKLRWFNECVGQDKLLLPNRYELSADLATKKCYVDGDLAPHVVAAFQDVHDTPRLRSQVLGRALLFVRPLNPHAGCFFLNREQMRVWMAQAGFGEPRREFIGPLESAATLSVLRAFQIYKPAPQNANFFELEHHGCQFIRKIRKT